MDSKIKLFLKAFLKKISSILQLYDEISEIMLVFQSALTCGDLNS